MYEPKNNLKIFYHILQLNPFLHCNTAQTSSLIIHKTQYDHLLTREYQNFFFVISSQKTQTKHLKKSSRL